MDIKEIINQRYAMPDASLDRLRQCLTEVSYPKGFRVLESGKIEKDIFFIKKGIVRAYTSVDGKEITFWIGKEGATLVSMKGYVNDEPGYETMELMEDSVLYVLERKKLKELFSEDLHIANWGRRYAEMELLATEERLISMLSAIASERYKELLEKEPDLLQRLPLGNIATYLGSAELLSVHRQRVADVAPHSDDNDEKPPDFGQGKTKFPQELHHVFDEVAHSRPASCCIWKLGSYVIGSIDSLASTE